MMKCKYCGGNLTLEQAYCPHCGRPNEEAAQHVKDMEHYKSNFEDTKSDVYEVAEKNTEIMSHMIIITVLVILCVVVFVVSARSWSIHRGLLQFDAGAINKGCCTGSMLRIEQCCYIFTLFD